LAGEKALHISLLVQTNCVIMHRWLRAADRRE